MYRSQYSLVYSTKRAETIPLENYMLFALLPLFFIALFTDTLVLDAAVSMIAIIMGARVFASLHMRRPCMLRGQAESVSMSGTSSLARRMLPLAMLFLSPSLVLCSDDWDNKVNWTGASSGGVLFPVTMALLAGISQVIKRDDDVPRAYPACMYSTESMRRAAVVSHERAHEGKARIRAALANYVVDGNYISMYRAVMQGCGIMSDTMELLSLWPDEGGAKRFRHFIAAKCLATELAASFANQNQCEAYVLDVDGTLMDGLPAKSDICILLTRDHFKTGNVVHVDITADPRLMGQKITGLANQISDYLRPDSWTQTAVVAHFRSDLTWSASNLSPKEPEHPAINFMSKLTQGIANARETRSNLVGRLKAELDGGFKRRVSRELASAFEQRAQNEDATNEIDSSDLPRLRSMACTNNVRFISGSGEMHGDPFASDLAHVSGVSIIHRKGVIRSIETPPAVRPMGKASDPTDLYKEMSSHDPFVFCHLVLKTAQSRLDRIKGGMMEGVDWDRSECEDMLEHGIVVLMGDNGYEHRIASASESALLNRSQNMTTFEMHAMIVAVSKMHRISRNVYRLYDEKKNVCKELPSTADKPEGYVLKKVYSHDGGMSTIVNPSFYSDDRFITFLRRKEPTTETSKSLVPISRQDLIKCHGDHIDVACGADVADDGVPALTTRLIETQGLGCFSQIAVGGSKSYIDMLRSAFSTTNMNRLDHLHSRSIALFKAFQGVKNKNNVSVVHAEPYMSLTIAFNNAYQNSFKTTWLKTYTQTEDKIRMKGPSGKVMPTGMVCSQFASIQRNRLVWEHDAVIKAVARIGYLVEQRHTYYETHAAEMVKECNWAVMPFLVNRQQFSVMARAIRYLHASLSSLSCAREEILKKLSGIALKSSEEVAIFGALLNAYSCGRHITDKYGMSAFRLPNGIYPMCPPDLLYSSANYSHIVSCYSLNTILNDMKGDNALTAEAMCVQELWSQLDGQELAKTNHEEGYYGLERAWWKSEWPEEPMDHLAAVVGKLEGHRVEYPITKIWQEITDHISKDLKAVPYVSSFWFELWCGLISAEKYGLASPLKSLAGLSPKKFYSTKGSLYGSNYSTFGPPANHRKASAATKLISTIVFGTDKLRATISMISPLDYLDQFLMALYMMQNWETVRNDILITDKNAPDKIREISTLNISYAVCTMLLEELFKSLSQAMDEDMIATPDKEQEIMRHMQKATQARDRGKGRVMFFYNGDKSKFGPTRRFANFYAVAASFAPDKLTGQYMAGVVGLNLGRRIRYPTQLLKSTILQVPKAGFKFSNVIETPAKLQGKSVASRTGRRMWEQIKGVPGSVGHGLPSGLPIVELEAGMPGQGIFGIISSIGHASLLHMMFDHLPESVEMFGKTTSDDSNVIIVVPAELTKAVQTNFMRTMCLFGAWAGLIENLGKFILSTTLAEMNSLFVMRGEPACPVQKFMTSKAAVTVTGNYMQDLQNAASLGGDLMMKGTSTASSTLVSAVVIAGSIRAYGTLPLYKAIQKAQKQLGFQLPMELGGLPTLCPLAGLISPMGAYATNILMARAALSDRDVRMSLARYTISNLLSPPTQRAIDGSECQHAQDVITIGEGKDLVILPTELRLKSSCFEIATRQVHRKVKLVKELGELFILDSADLVREDLMTGCHIVDIWQSIHYDLRKPLHDGSDFKDSLDMVQKVSHSLGYKKVVIQHDSILKSCFKGAGQRIISMNMLISFYEDGDMMNRLLRKWRFAVAAAKAPSWCEAYAADLEYHLCYVMGTILSMTEKMVLEAPAPRIITRNVGKSTFRKMDPYHPETFGSDWEAAFGVSRAVDAVVNKLIRLPAASGTTVDLRDITASLSSSMLTQDDYDLVPTSLRHTTDIESYVGPTREARSMTRVKLAQISSMIESAMRFTGKTKTVYIRTALGQVELTKQMSDNIKYNTHSALQAVENCAEMVSKTLRFSIRLKSKIQMTLEPSVLRGHLTRSFWSSVQTGGFGQAPVSLIGLGGRRYPDDMAIREHTSNEPALVTAAANHLAADFNIFWASRRTVELTPSACASLCQAGAQLGWCGMHARSYRVMTSWLFSTNPSGSSKPVVVITERIRTGRRISWVHHVLTSGTDALGTTWESCNQYLPISSKWQGNSMRLPNQDMLVAHSLSSQSGWSFEILGDSCFIVLMNMHAGVKYHAALPLCHITTKLVSETLPTPAVPAKFQGAYSIDQLNECSVFGTDYVEPMEAAMVLASYQNASSTNMLASASLYSRAASLGSRQSKTFASIETGEERLYRLAQQSQMLSIGLGACSLLDALPLVSEKDANTWWSTLGPLWVVQNLSTTYDILEGALVRDPDEHSETISFEGDRLEEAREDQYFTLEECELIKYDRSKRWADTDSEAEESSDEAIDLAQDAIDSMLG